MGAAFRTTEEGKLIIKFWDYDGVTGKCGKEVGRVEIDLKKYGRVEYDIEEGGHG